MNKSDEESRYIGALQLFQWLMDNATNEKFYRCLSVWNFGHNWQLGAIRAVCG